MPTNQVLPIDLQIPLKETANVSLISRENWDKELKEQGCEDIYFSYGYGDASTHLEPNGVPVLLKFTDEVTQNLIFLPLIIRSIDGQENLLDATAAYGYGGAVASDASFDITNAYKEWCDANNIVTTFLRFFPLTQNQSLVPEDMEVIELGKTVVWNTSDSERDLEAAMHKHHRRVVRKARREEVTSEVLVSTPEEPFDLTQFKELYDTTMKRQNAESFYFFPDSYWEKLALGAGGKIVLINSIKDDEVIASLLCMTKGNTLHYHLGASADSARGIGASNLAFLTAAQWAQENSIDAFHLGGGVGGAEDSLFQFKHRYDPESEPRIFAIGKQINNLEMYKNLTGSESLDGFFPAYRARS